MIEPPTSTITKHCGESRRLVSQFSLLCLGSHLVSWLPVAPSFPAIIRTSYNEGPAILTLWTFHSFKSNLLKVSHCYCYYMPTQISPGFIIKDRSSVAPIRWHPGQFGHMLLLEYDTRHSSVTCSQSVSRCVNV